MRRKPLIAAAIALAASVAVGLVGTTPASAAQKFSKTDIEYIRVAMQKYDVPQKVQNRLIEDFKAGKRWDSQNGATPVSTEVTRVGGVERTIYRYEDGSINVSEIEIPVETGGDEVTPTAISGCQSYPKAGAKAWINCKVSWDALSWSVHFYADYGYWLGPAYGCFIDYIRSFSYSGAGSFSNPKLEYITKTASGYSTECLAQGTVVQSTPVFSDTVGVRLHVSAQHGGGWSSLAI